MTLPSVVRSGVIPNSALRALQSHAKSGHNFIEYQHRSVTRAQVTQCSQKLSGRRHEIHVAGNRLDDDCRDPIALRPENCFQHCGIVIVEHDRVRGDLRGYTGRTRLAQCQRARTSFHQKRVRVSVIAALELDYLRASRKATRQPDRGHRRLGARTDQANLLHRRQAARNPFRHLQFQLRWCSEAQPARSGILHGPDDFRMGVTQHQRPPGSHVVDVALAIGVPHIGAFAASNKYRRAADRAECPHRRIHPSRDDQLGFLEQDFISGSHACISRIEQAPEIGVQNGVLAPPRPLHRTVR